MAIAKSRSYLGIALETGVSTVGQFAGTLPTPTSGVGYVPITGLTPLDNIKYLDDKGMRGSMVATYGLVQGIV